VIIYKVANKISGNIYIGQTVKSLQERKRQHIKKSQNPKSKFHKAIKSYGVDNFNWEVIDTANSKDELNKKEIRYITEYNSIENGYNMISGGTGGYNKFAVNVNRKKRRGKTYEEIYNSLDTINKLKKLHKETYRKAKLDRWNFKNLSKDDRISMAKLGNQTRTMNGYKHSEETIEKIRQSQIGKVISEETKNLISNRTKEAMKSVDRDLLGKKSVEARKKYWDNKHQQDRQMILKLKANGYSVKRICAELNISTPTYYKRYTELKENRLMYF
jgi:group I intron endonuclease